MFSAIWWLPNKVCYEQAAPPPYMPPYTGVSEADSLVLLVDGQEGLQAGDREILMWLRQTHPNKKVVLAVNKCENPSKADIMVRDPVPRPYPLPSGG